MRPLVLVLKSSHIGKKEVSAKVQFTGKNSIMDMQVVGGVWPDSERGKAMVIEFTSYEFIYLVLMVVLIYVTYKNTKK